MRTFLRVYADLLNDSEYLNQLASDMLSAEGVTEDPTDQQIKDKRREAIQSGYLMDIARELYDAEREES